MNLQDKVILVDCDGVLCDWEYAFGQWMKRHEYEVNPEYFDEYMIGKRYGLEGKDAKRLIRMFNESAWIRKLPPLRDAIHYVKKLHTEHGYVFHCITSLSNDDYSQHLRTKNLRELFGDTVFEKYVYLDTGADKDEVLNAYKGTGCYWIEDKPANAVAGMVRGLNSILVNHPHNKNFDASDVKITRVQNCKEIYDLIANEN